MKSLPGLAVTALFVSFVSAYAFAQTDGLPAGCIAFKEVKFRHLPAEKYAPGQQRIWVRITNNCGQDLRDLRLEGYVTTAPASQNWEHRFTYAFLPVKAGRVGTGVAPFTAAETTYLRLTIEKDRTVLAEKIFEPKDFDTLRRTQQDTGKALPTEAPAPSTHPRLR